MTATAPEPSEPTEPDESTVAGWLRSNIHRLRTIDPADDDFSDLEPLREIVGDARVVSIGESTHRVHEFYQVRHRLARFLITRLGFTAFVMESGFPEGQAVNEWVLGGPGAITELLRRGITYHMGKCREMRDHLEWMRCHNASRTGKVRFYGMDLPDSAASAKPAVEACLAFLADADPAYAETVRASLLPLFDYLPTDRTGLAWAAPALQAYLGIDPAVRYELTARIADLTERFAAMRVVYTGKAEVRGQAGFADQCAVTARHTDAFLAAMAAASNRAYRGANIRDMAIAENVEWILRREERIVLTAANGHLQRWPLHVPPIINDELTTAGEHLARSLGRQMVVIGSSFGGGTLWQHRPIPGGPPGHTETFAQDIGRFTEPDNLDAFLARTRVRQGILDLRKVPAQGPVSERFAELTSIMNGPIPQPVNPMAAFDAVVFVDTVTPWHTFLGEDDAAKARS
jgi:erythromycin esterase